MGEGSEEFKRLQQQKLTQMKALTEVFRVIRYDRRGHGRSSQPWTGNDMDTLGR